MPSQRRSGPCGEENSASVWAVGTGKSPGFGYVRGSCGYFGRVSNLAFIGALAEKGYTQSGVAEAVNEVLRARGHEGTVGDRTVRTWVTGSTRWPHRRQREALEAVFGCTVEELGFEAPVRRHPTSARESTVKRRTFVSTVTGTAAVPVAALCAGAPPSVGTSDVIRLRNGLDSLAELDDTKGGHESLERAALAGAAEALELQKRSATQRTRRRLFSVAADYTGSAAWSALDSRQSERASNLLHQALYLTGMAQDAVAELCVWNLCSILARQQGDYAKAVDAALAAQSTLSAKRDPFLMSLAHARTAIGHSHTGGRHEALRSMGYAQEALDKAGDRPRPSWVAFYGRGELAALDSCVRAELGDFAEAEAASHHALVAIPSNFRRNRAMATMRLALAQLHQGDIDQACATTSEVFELLRGVPFPGRLRSLLGDFHRGLADLAPGSYIAQEWRDRYRSEWSRA
ncbi:Hypothetical protein SCLAV_2783 [Streptomyces clavuligerus]|uniref:Uncharacterized protein n=1 Tax=Streptomyces clavuligerus TaxID=1901 RepID=E2PVE1_STRCL|nr:Hypothetical protein SCLAV_2783 [Streptomyces clavuligerus]